MLASAIVGFTIFGGIETVILNLYLLRLGYGSKFIGWVNATGALTNTLVALPLGLLGLRVSRRSMMMIGMLLMVSGIGALPFAEFLPGHMVRPWLLVTRGISYLGMGVFQIGGTPFLIGATRPEERNHAYAFHTAIGPLAGLAGGLVGGLLPSVFAGLSHASLSDSSPYRQTPLDGSALPAAGFLPGQGNDRSAPGPAAKNRTPEQLGTDDHLRTHLLLRLPPARRRACRKDLLQRVYGYGLPSISVLHRQFLVNGTLSFGRRRPL